MSCLKSCPFLCSVFSLYCICYFICYLLQLFIFLIFSIIFNLNLQNKHYQAHGKKDKYVYMRPQWRTSDRKTIQIYQYVFDFTEIYILSYLILTLSLCHYLFILFHLSPSLNSSISIYLYPFNFFCRRGTHTTMQCRWDDTSIRHN